VPPTIPQHLGCEITGDFSGLEFACGRHGDRDRRIQMRATEGRGTKRANEHCEPPSGSDDNPATVVAFRSCQDHVGDNTIAEENEQGRSDEFREIGAHVG